MGAAEIIKKRKSHRKLQENLPLSLQGQKAGRLLLVKHCHKTMYCHYSMKTHMDWGEERMEIILGPLKRDVPSVKPGLPAPCWKVKGFSGTSHLDPHSCDCCCNILETNLKKKKN